MALVSVTYSMRNDKAQCKVQPATGHEGPDGEQRYISTLSLTSTLDGCGWSAQRAGRFNPKQGTRVNIAQRADFAPGQSGRVRKMSPPPGFDTQITQSIPTRYTD
jgi:hypothetical protein